MTLRCRSLFLASVLSTVLWSVMIIAGAQAYQELKRDRSSIAIDSSGARAGAFTVRPVGNPLSAGSDGTPEIGSI
ncbi:hypothetical protein BTR14_19910 [Rhizobium rhizosphaerae]|uniref:Uncharacterized protein n=2 Tax=Xaviernesmea rhizosphaerae TaxID=1672749 RepID=A0ABX3P9B3_9HYPH|nr:hypothetical protein BTR14_19910 [Xaviernesmea rhizosphaerae]